MNKLTIVIPIYNVEKYIERGMESIVRQENFSELNIILIDDGSEDESYTKCIKYIEEYDNIKYVKKKNGGVSSARNYGINNTVTKYICFFDPDDEVEKNYYKNLLNIIENKSVDLVSTNFSLKFTDNIVRYKLNKCELEISKKDEIIRNFLSGGKFANNLFNKIYSTDIAKKVMFDENINIGEDMLFNYNYLKKCNKIYIDNRINGYIYYKNEQSAMNTMFNLKFFDTLDVSKKITEMEEDTVNYRYALAHEQHERCKLLEYMIIKNGKEKYIDKWQEEYKKLKKYNILKNIKNLSKRQILGIILMKISPKLYVSIYKIMRVG